MKLFLQENMIFDISSIQNWAKAQIPALHEKPNVYHLIPQVKELLIKISWSIMLGVMKTQNVHIFQPYGAPFVFL